MSQARTAAPSINRLQKLIETEASGDLEIAALTPAWQLSGAFGMTSPESLAFDGNLAAERAYVADRANNGIVRVDLPLLTPNAIWDDAKTKLIAGDFEGALVHFASSVRARFRDEFMDLGGVDLTEMMSAIGSLSPIFIDHDIAQYRYSRTYQGKPVRFQHIFQQGKRHMENRKFLSWGLGFRKNWPLCWRLVCFGLRVSFLWLGLRLNVLELRARGPQL